MALTAWARNLLVVPHYGQQIAHIRPAPAPDIAAGGATGILPPSVWVEGVSCLLRPCFQHVNSAPMAAPSTRGAHARSTATVTRRYQSPHSDDRSPVTQTGADPERQE